MRTAGLGAQRAWEEWTTKAEDWLLKRADVPREAEGPYKGRGTPPAVRMRMPLPVATHQRHGEVHGKARIWAAQANRYRELARAREERRTYYADLLTAAIVANPPRGSDLAWAQRDQKIAEGRATTGEIGSWAREAKALAEEENRRVTAARRKAWGDWVATSWSRSPGKVYAWCKTERPAPILSTTDERGEWLLSPNDVAQEAAEQWGKLWKPPAADQEPRALPFGDLPGMPPLSGELLWDIVRHIPRAKAQGLDAWAPDDLKALPREAYDDLAAVLTIVEAEGTWPEGLSGAIVALLPKKGDHGPLAQRPISLLPMVYRLWAAARGAILKDWFVREGHASAWGQGKGKGADTAAWMAAAQAELAAAGGYDAFAAYIDCEKCYDHISLSDLSFQGCLQGMGRLVSLAAAQYAGKRYVRWAGALSRPVDPTHGIPAGCPLANGMLHLFLLRAMRGTADRAQGAELRTYADDWRLFSQGLRRKAATDLVGAFVVASDELRSHGHGCQPHQVGDPGLGGGSQGCPPAGCGRLWGPGRGPRQGPWGRRHPCGH